MQKAIRLLFPIGVLILGWIGFGYLSTEKASPKRPAMAPRIIRTRVLEMNRQDYQTVIQTQGVVRAHNEASLTAQVGGKVKAIAAELQDGAFFEKGDVLVELDTEDLAAGIVSAEADLARAQAAYAQEEARANQAKRNWEDLGYKEEPNELVLRLPQLREAQANVDAAEATVQRAKRDLDRAVVHAPFDGRVLQRSVSLGQSITASSVLAVVFNTDFVEVRLPIAARQLASLDLPESQDDPPVDVLLSDAMNDGNQSTWKGQIIGTEGALDPESRELFAIARVKDPFSRKSDERRSPLRIGQPVRALIDGRVLKDVFVVPRSAVRSLKLIYIVDAEKETWQVHEIEPVWKGLEELIVRDSTIPDKALLATTRQTYAPNIAKVEILPEPEPEPEEVEETPVEEKAESSS